MSKRAFLTIPIATIAVAAFAPAIVDAHDGTASGTCNGGVQWEYAQYDKTVVNSITVTIDGVVRWQDLDFKASDTGQILTDKTIPHTWEVFVNAPGTQFDKHPSGSYAACQTAPTTVAPTTTVAATTTTIAATTTSVPLATTTVPPATEPTTTSIVAVDIPPVPTTTPTASSVVLGDGVAVEPALPRTGIDHGDLAAIAVTLLLCGGFLLYVRREAR